MSVRIPTKMVERYEKILKDVKKLEDLPVEDDRFNIFWDDVMTAMENRLKVVMKK